MKPVAIFALRVVVLTISLVIVFLVGVNVAAAWARYSPQQPVTSPSAILPPLLTYAFLVSIVVAWIIQNSRWRGWKLIMALIFTVYGLMSFISDIEMFVYLRAKMPSALMKQLFIMGAVVPVLFVPIAVLIMGKVCGSEEPATLSANTKLDRFALLAVVYVVLYYLFGYYVAWQNPDVRLYYAGSTELKTFFDQMRSTIVGTPWMLPFQFFRGVLWVLFAYPVLRMLKATRVETAFTIAALFGVWSFPLLLPNPLMPASVAHTHFWETLWSDLILGATVGWTLAKTGASRSRATGDSISEFSA